jgi:hypothetical protein
MVDVVIDWIDGEVGEHVGNIGNPLRASAIMLGQMWDVEEMPSFFSAFAISGH